MPRFRATRLPVPAFAATMTAVLAGPQATARAELDLLLCAAIDGDRTAYRHFLDQADTLLRHWYARRVPPADAQDLVQDVLVAVHAKRHTYDRRFPARPWLLGIARYKWIDWLRRDRRSMHHSVDDSFDIADDSNAHPAYAPLLEQLLSRLPPRQAEVIRLVKLSGFSIEEASAASGQSVPLVKVNIHRGLARLRALIGDEDRVQADGV